MDIINLKIKFMVTWLISKKNAIYRLSGEGIPLLRTISTFVKEYIDTMGDFVILVEKLMEQKRIKAKNQQILIEAMNAIRKRELASIEQWKETYEVLKDQKTNNKKIQAIFQNLDSDISYYTKLRERILDISKNSPNHQQSQHKTFSQGFITERPYHRNYSQYNISPRSYNRKNAGKIKINKPEQQLSPYKLVNSPLNRYATDRERRIRFDLENNMKKDLQSKQFFAKKKLNQFNLHSPETPQKIKLTPKKQQIETSSTHIKKTVKKYKYLFEQDSPPKYETPPQYQSAKESPRPTHNKTQKKVKLYDYFSHQNIERQTPQYKLVKPFTLNKEQRQLDELKLFPDDSLDEKDNDKLGRELATEINQSEISSLEKILTDSLMSSKKWENNENEDSLQDIRQTGKFKYFAIDTDQISFGD